MVRMLTSLLLIGVTTVLARSRKPVDPKANDITNNGNYRIARCGKDIPGGKADQLISLLQRIGADLPSMITEASMGLNSTHGFKSLFTSNDAIPAVIEYFTKISNSASVSVRGRPKQITFTCLERDDPWTAQVWRSMVKMPGRIAGLSTFDNEEIFLTPYFFTLGRDPPPFKCPYFFGEDLVLHGDQELTNTQYATIIHELLDKYLDFSGRGFHVNEVYYFNECIKLPAGEQQLNAENYALFASAIKADCKGFPK